MSGRVISFVCALGALCVVWTGCTSPQDGHCHIANEHTASPVVDTHSGTVIIFQCDKPEEVGKRDRTYKAEITADGFWEEFQIPITREGGTVRLRNNFPVGEVAMIRFVVPEEPDFLTKFSRAEWFYRAAPSESLTEPGKSVMTVPLSRFRNMDQRARTLMQP